MSSPWKNLQPNDFVVAHITDPHFGSKNAEEVWSRIEQFLKATVKPKLLLISGDLVHTPKSKNFRIAKARLDALQIEYYLCPGNHDRHTFGNRWLSWLPVRFVRRWSTIILFALLGYFIWRWWSEHTWIWLTVTFITGLVAAGLWNWLLPKSLGSLRGFLILRVAALFDRVFAGHVLQPHDITSFTIGDGPDAWDLSLLGLDSCNDPDFFARGFVDGSNSQQVVDACKKSFTQGRLNECDLSLLLVHHHLLSIRELEKSRQGKISDLFNATCMVNSGSVLERLSEARIDLILHGHEHSANSGSYQSLETGYGQVHVLGAGSVTGNQSVGGCDVDRSTFNVIILAADRSVRLRRVLCSDGAWHQERETDIMLLTAEGVRHSRVKRRVLVFAQEGSNAEVRSEITKHCVFTRERDIQVSWIMTEWRITTSQFKHPVWNSTGWPSDLDVVLDGHEGVKEGLNPEFILDQSEEHMWQMSFNVPPEYVNKNLTVTISFRWVGGGLLTFEELQALQHRRGGIGKHRNQGFESATIWTRSEPCAALNLHVTLPPEYSVPRRKMEIVVEEGANHFQSEALSLRPKLYELGKGTYSLRINYPRVNRDYTIRWQPVANQDAQEIVHNDWAIARFKDAAESAHEQILETFRGALEECGFRFAGTLELFTQSNATTVRRVGVAAVGESQIALPERGLEIFLSSDLNPLLRAWWGVVSTQVRPQDNQLAPERGFLSGEIAVICVPLRYTTGDETPSPWGVIRIGLHSSLEPAFDSDERSIIWALTTAAANCLARAVLPEMSP